MFGAWGPLAYAWSPNRASTLYPHLLNISPRLPVAANAIPLLGRADQQVGGQQSAQVGGVVTCRGQGSGGKEGAQRSGLGHPQKHVPRVNFSGTGEGQREAGQASKQRC